MSGQVAFLDCNNPKLVVAFSVRRSELLSLRGSQKRNLQQRLHVLMKPWKEIACKVSAAVQVSLCMLLHSPPYTWVFVCARRGVLEHVCIQMCLCAHSNACYRLVCLSHTNAAATHNRCFACNDNEKEKARLSSLHQRSLCFPCYCCYSFSVK